jgi:hypothetical protein
MYKRRLWLFLILLLLVIIPSVAAQSQNNPLPIQYGQTVNGQFASSSDYFFYAFTGNAGDIVQISATSSMGVDTYVQLGDANANLLAENDDTYGFDPYLEFILPSAGNYLIGIGAYGAGPYSLTLNSPNAALVQPPPLQSTGQQQQPYSPAVPNAIPIQYGQTLTGRTIDINTNIFYAFVGNAGDQVVITATSTEVDTFLQFGNANADLLAENDDADGTNSRIETTLQESGTYLIGVSGYGAGNFSLTLSNANQPIAQPPQQQGGQGAGETIPIQYGQTVTGNAIDLETPILYGFSGSTGDVIIIEVVSDIIDTYVLLGDSAGTVIAENDDISSTDLNSRIDFVLPATGNYIIGVLGYKPGPFTLTLTGTSGGGTVPDITPVSQTVGDVFSGEVSDAQPFVEFPVDNVPEGARITVQMTTTSGDLDGYLGLVYGGTVVAENDDCVQGNLNPCIEFPQAAGGNYIVVATRYSFEEGQTSGTFDIAIDVSGGGGVALPTDGGTTAPNPVASGYPQVSPQPVAEWTILAYYGADNNLEGDLIIDLDEFEIGGGTNETVRVLMMIDRSGEYDPSNGDWTGARLYEVTADTSQDVNLAEIPTIDSRLIADLGELDSSYGANLTNFLVWSMTNYPARRYAVAINDHGGGWSGTVWDDTTGSPEALTVPELAQAFQTALQATNTPKFDLFIPDSCLMSSVEVFTAISPYFNYSLGSPEVTLSPGFDMTLVTSTLRSNPGISMVDLGKMAVDKYMSDMSVSDLKPLLGAAITDLNQFNPVAQAVEDFAAFVNANPSAYINFLGQVRANTYRYSFFLAEDQYGPPTMIDLGDFMAVIAAESPDPQLAAAAQNVLNTLGGPRVYAQAGDHLGKWSGFYNIYFPPEAAWFNPNYFDQSPLQNWAQMLRNYFGGVSAAGTRGVRAVGGVATPPPSLMPSAAVDLIPTVKVTNVYPQVTSILTPTSVSVEVVARNVSFGNFTVDQIQPDGSAIRLSASRIVTQVIEDGVVNWVNKWHPGVDETNFSWDVTLPIVTDGTNSFYELVTTQDEVSSLAGRYRAPGSDTWQDVSVLFGDDNVAENVIGTTSSGGAGLAAIDLAAGGEFQVYRSVVTPDGRVNVQPGNSYIWPEGGISYDWAPAPTAEYELGFFVESFSGASGFDSTRVSVNNDNVDQSLLGYVDTDWGLEIVYPAEWFGFTYFPDSDWLQANAHDESQYFFVYPAYNATDIASAIAEVSEKYTVNPEGATRPITIAGGIPAEEYDFSYTIDNGAKSFLGRAFAFYKADLGMGFVMSAEALDGVNLDQIYVILRDNLKLFDSLAYKAQDTGEWQNRFYGDFVRLPIPANWIEQGVDDTFYAYALDDTLTTVAAVAEIPGSTDPVALANDLINRYLVAQPGFEQTGQETYYGENHTWTVISYRYQGMVGRMQVTVKAETGTAYALWTEAPEAQGSDLMRNVFDHILDGFIVND